MNQYGFNGTKKKANYICVFFTLSTFLKWRLTQVFLKRNLHLSHYVQVKFHDSQKSLQVIACTIHLVAQMSCKVFIFTQYMFVFIICLADGRFCQSDQTSFHWLIKLVDGKQRWTFLASVQHIIVITWLMLYLSRRYHYLQRNNKYDSCTRSLKVS